MEIFREYKPKNQKFWDKLSTYKYNWVCQTYLDVLIIDLYICVLRYIDDNSLLYEYKMLAILDTIGRNESYIQKFWDKSWRIRTFDECEDMFNNILNTT